MSEHELSVARVLLAVMCGVVWCCVGAGDVGLMLSY